MNTYSMFHIRKWKLRLPIDSVCLNYEFILMLEIDNNCFLFYNYLCNVTVNFVRCFKRKRDFKWKKVRSGCNDEITQWSRVFVSYIYANHRPLYSKNGAKISTAYVFPISRWFVFLSSISYLISRKIKRFKLSYFLGLVLSYVP